MANYPTFSEEAVQSAIGAARDHYANKKECNTVDPIDDGHLSTLAECITITIENGKACLNLPLGIGNFCIPVPDIYNGKVASACVSICTFWGIPTGAKVTVSVGGVVIISKTFLKC